ncbi:hypothetical protein J2783_000558 [Chryseobacterium sediminis]|nr:hypothetical protein [Chryseobacterium sediminis]
MELNLIPSGSTVNRKNDVSLKKKAPEERPVNTKSVREYIKNSQIIGCFILHEINVITFCKASIYVVLFNVFFYI